MMEQVEMTDLDGLATHLHLSKNTVQRFWTELPYIRIPGSKGIDARGVRFLVDDVVAYLVKNNGVNYGNICVQNEVGAEIQSQPVHKRKAGGVEVGFSDKTRRKKMAGGRNAKRGTVPPPDDPHGLLTIRQ